MIHIVLRLLFFFGSVSFCFGQQASDDFRQKVDYRIDLRLDDTSNTIQANLRMVYHNHSPSTLDTLIIHLWANAYKSNQTAFAKQQLQHKNTSFHFIPEEDRGGYTSIVCYNNGIEIPIHPYQKQLDIQYIELPHLLHPGDSLHLHFTYELQIPKSVSRFGRAGTSFQITQWYPKPAVFDKNGWHPMPYLDQGEFYSEFGDYEVEITLPSQYIVAATGVLQTESERNMLIEKSQELKDLSTAAQTLAHTDSGPPDTGNWKTITYTAEKVHDFAWFADSRFQLSHDRMLVPGHDSIDVWAFYRPERTGLWLGATNYLSRSISFLSEKIGPYPYPQVTAVDGALSAGAGMEYPMITIIGSSPDAKSLDEVITHEVAHNWWYGILASNERDHPWIDEGFASFYETRYMKKFYPATRSPLAQLEDPDLFDKAFWLFEMTQSNRLDQSPSLPSADFSDVNYYLSIYYKSSRSIEYLYRLDSATFDQTVQSLYRKYAFTHIQPEDIIHHFAKAYDKQDLSWLFEGLLASNAPCDYAITNYTRENDELILTLKNKGDIQAPLLIHGITTDQSQPLHLEQGFVGEKQIRLPISEDVHAVQLNPDYILPEKDFGNNTLFITDRSAHRKKLSFGFLSGIEAPTNRKIYALPVPGYNKYDGFQLGLWLHNVSINDRPFSFSILPMYGVASGKLNGIVNVKYQKNFAHSALQSLTLGADAQAFSMNHSNSGASHLRERFRKFAPYLSILWRKRATSFWTHRTRYRAIGIQRRIEADDDIVLTVPQKVSYWVHQLYMDSRYDHPIYPFEGRLLCEQSVGGQRFQLTGNQSIQYKKGKWMRIRLFAGYMNATPSEIFDNRFVGSGTTGPQWNIGRKGTDYTHDHILLGRSATEGFWSQQIFTRDGSFKTTATNIHSSDFLTTLGLSFDLPLPVPIHTYVDMGTWTDYRPPAGQKWNAAFSSGLAISLLQRTLEIYFPIWESRQITNSIRYRTTPGYFQRVSFQLRLRQWHVFKMKERLQLF